LADALRLKPGNTSESHLSGNLIDAYMNFLVANYTNIKALSLSLITHYSRHKSLPRRINIDWIKEFDGTLFAPIHLPQHWALLAANFRECTITTMDSLNMDHFLNCDIQLFIRNFRFVFYIKNNSDLYFSDHYLLILGGFIILPSKLILGNGHKKRTFPNRQTL
jgi:hypothetical protein